MILTDCLWLQFEWDAETTAPLRVEGVATAERNNMVTFLIDTGAKSPKFDLKLSPKLP